MPTLFTSAPPAVQRTIAAFELVSLCATAALVFPLPALAQDSKSMSDKDCRNVNFPSSEQRVVRACDASYGLCANPPPAWQQSRQAMEVCEQIRRERQLQAAATPGLSPQVLSRSTAPALNAPMPVAASVAAPAAAASLSSPWRINGNGFPGEVTVQQAADGTLAGAIYGEPLTGYYAPGEGVGVWLRGAPTQPIQAFVGQATPDGSSFSGRFYGLNASNSGATPQRNVFAFSALRAAPSHPSHPGVPNAAAGPASVTGALPLNANNIPGSLVLNQAPDGSLSGSIYGDRLTGHYAQGTGSIAFLRFTGAQPVQLYIGNVSAQGISGEFYALTVPAGGSAQRMRYSWSAQAPQVAQSPVAPAPATVAPGLRPLPSQAGQMTAPMAAPVAAPMVMPAQPAAVFNAASPDEAVLAPYPRGFDIPANGRRFDGFAVGQPGPVRVMVRSAQSIVVGLRRPDGRMVERSGSGDLAIDDAASAADVQQSLFWSVSIRPQQAGGGAQGQIMVSHPPADPQAVSAALARNTEQARSQAQSALAQAPAGPAADPNAVLAARQRELDQQTLARHSAALQNLRTQLPADTVAVMSQAQQARAQGQPLAQTQQAMVSDTRLQQFAAAGVLSPSAPAGITRAAPSGGRLLAPSGGGAAASAQGGGASAQGGGTPASPAVAGAIDRAFKKDGSAPPPSGGAAQQVAARPLITSTSEAGGDPGTPVMIQGTNFGNTRGEVRFIVANGRDLPAPIAFWSATQVMAEVPDVSGVREFAGQMYVKRADGAQSDLRPFAFRPAMERRHIGPIGRAERRVNAPDEGFIEDAVVHPYALLWKGWGSSHVPNGGYVSRLSFLFGGSGSDQYFLNGRLANGWRVESCTIGSRDAGTTTPRVTRGQATATIKRCPVGSDVLRTDVDWWIDFASGINYSLRLNIIGPKGVPHQ
jgi:hypothetical protein